jgi:hypothetical protein
MVFPKRSYILFVRVWKRILAQQNFRNLLLEELMKKRSGKTEIFFRGKTWKSPGI